MNPTLLAMIAVVFGGAATALQAPTNAKMMTAVGSPVNAAFVSFAIGTAALGILAVVLQSKPDMAAARSLPWYAWVGGLYGAVFVVAVDWFDPADLPEDTHRATRARLGEVFGGAECDGRW